MSTDPPLLSHICLCMHVWKSRRLPIYSAHEWFCGMCVYADGFVDVWIGKKEEEERGTGICPYDDFPHDC